MGNSNTVEVEFVTKGGNKVVAESEKISGSLRGIGSGAQSSLPGTTALSSQLTMIGSAGIAAGIAAVVIAVTRLGTDIYAVNKEFGQFNAQLVTLTGSQAGADKVFAQLEAFAAKTPYQLNEVVGAFAKLKARGLDPSEAALTSYGNTASGMGRSLDQMIEAVADASTGEFERLKEFGINARTEGDQIQFTFKGVSTTVAKEAGAIEGYLRMLGETQFAGGMSRQMDELGGKASNLGDSWDGLMRAIGNVGATEGMKGSIGFLTQSLQGWTMAINDVNVEMQTAGEWMAAYSIGQVSFWEWMTTGADEARIKLRGLKDEMAGRAPDAMESSHDPAGAAERIAKIKAQAEREEQARLDATKAARKKAAAEEAALQKAMALDAITARVDAQIAADAFAEQVRSASAAEARAVYFADLELTKTMEIASINARVEAWVEGARLKEELVKAIMTADEDQAQYYLDRLVEIDAAQKAGLINDRIAWEKRSAQGAGYLASITAASANSSKMMFQIHKIAALSEGALNLRSAVMGSYKVGASIGGPPLGAAFATISLAAQVANLTAIASSQYGGGGGGASGSGGGGVAESAATQLQGPSASSSSPPAAPSKIYEIHFNGYVDANDPDSLARKLSSALRKAESDGY